VAQSLSYPTPDAPSPTPPTTSITISSGMGAVACTAAVAPGWACSISGNTVTLTPTTSNTVTLGNVTVGSNTVLSIGGTSPVMNVNSFSLGSNASMTLATSSTNFTMNIAGNSLGSTKPLDLSGGGDVNTGGAAAYKPAQFQIVYAGTAELDMVGNNNIAATIYAPNASVKTTGHGNLYGSILSNTFTDTGGASIHYDSSLSSKLTTLGNHVLTSFSWKKY
jgi:hypothetical protein